MTGRIARRKTRAVAKKKTHVVAAKPQSEPRGDTVLFSTDDMWVRVDAERGQIGISDFCHPEVFPSKGIPVMCVGQCPSDPAELVCAEIRTLTGTGVLVTCQCLPPGDR